MTELGEAVHLTDAPVGSDEWLQARRTRINGSEIAAVLGISPFESPFSLWHRKAGGIAQIEQNDVMYWGTRSERMIREEWNLRHPDLVVAPTGQWRHRTRAWQGGSPDGIGQGRLWEGKTSRYDDGWGEEGTEEIPVYYWAQGAWYLDVFGYQVCDVSVLITGSDYREYVIRYDPEQVAVMREAAEAFLATLVADQAPPIDGHEATYRAVKELHPDIAAASVDLPDRLAVPYLQSLAACRDAEAEKRRAAAEVIQHMGSARDAYYGGQRIARRQARTTEGSTPYLVAARGAVDLHQPGSEAA